MIGPDEDLVAPANGPTDPITLVVADDHQVVRAGLRLLLESEPRFVVSAEAGSVADAIAAVERLGPRVLVLDHGMQNLIETFDLITHPRRFGATSTLLREQVIEAVGCPACGARAPGTNKSPWN